MKRILQHVIRSSALLFFCTSVQAQLSNDCDDVRINGTAFDSLFQHEFMVLKADTILAVKHCYNTFNCGQSFGILCWKENGKYVYKLFIKNKGEVKIKTEISSYIQEQMTSFFTDEMYFYTETIKNDMIIDDGSYSIIVYYSNTYCCKIGFSSTHINDLRVQWFRNLMRLVRL